MKIFVGADHAGFGFKEILVPFLKECGHEVIDKGAHEYNEEDDYPDFIIPVAREVALHPNEVRGIILGGSGQGEAMCANKFRDVRAVVYYGQAHTVGDVHDSVIMLSRSRNNANILSLGARFISEEQMKEAVKNWLEIPFAKQEKDIRRLNKIDKIHD